MIPYQWKMPPSPLERQPWNEASFQVPSSWAEIPGSWRYATLSKCYPERIKVYHLSLQPVNNNTQLETFWKPTVVKCHFRENGQRATSVAKTSELWQMNSTSRIELFKTKPVTSFKKSRIKSAVQDKWWTISKQLKPKLQACRQVWGHEP